MVWFGLVWSGFSQQQAEAQADELIELSLAHYSLLLIDSEQRSVWPSRMVCTHTHTHTQRERVFEKPAKGVV